MAKIEVTPAINTSEVLDGLTALAEAIERIDAAVDQLKSKGEFSITAAVVGAIAKVTVTFPEK